MFSLGHLHGQLIEFERQMQLVHPDHLKSTGNTTSEVLLNLFPALRCQLMLLQAVDVSLDFIVHRSGGLTQNVDSQQY